MALMDSQNYKFNPPDKINFVNHDWIKNHHENYTGSKLAYNPSKNLKAKEEAYKKWHPEN